MNDSGVVVVGSLTAKGPTAMGAPEVDAGHYVVHSLRAEGFDASEDGTGRGTPIIPIQSANTVREKKQNGIGIGSPGDAMFTLTGRDQHAIAFQQNASGEVRDSGVAYTLNQNSNASGRNTGMVHLGMAVRRLTPRECERLQGFPDDYTAIPWRGKPAEQCPDGPRYKALGNSMAEPVVRWIGERIQLIENL